MSPGSQDQKPVNNFLDSFQAGVDLTGSNVLHGSPIVAPVDIELVWNFLRTETKAKIKTHTAQTVLSGESYYLASGEVLQQQIYTRPEQSAGTELVSQYVNTQLGLTIKLSPFFSGGSWVVQYDVKDTEVDGSGSQNNTETMGSVELRSERSVLLASLNRAQRMDTEVTVPGLAHIPLIGSIFRSHEVDRTGRVLYVFLQLGSVE
jgi:type II secretory pathway component GspD/PulD (secretin)